MKPTQNHNRPIVVLIRVSTKAQGKRGVGFTEQRASNSEFAKQYGFHIVQQFEETSSAMTQDLNRRPILKQAVELADQMGCPLLVDRLDRLGRNQELIETVRARVEVMASTEGGVISDKQAAIQAARAEAVGRELSERSRKGLKKFKSAGGRCGSPNPRAGGKARGNQITAETASFDARVLPKIAEIKHKARGHLSLREIATILNHRGEPAPRGGSWSANTVRRVIERSKRPSSLHSTARFYSRSA